MDLQSDEGKELYDCVRRVTKELNICTKSDITPIFAVLEPREMSDFERRLAVRVHYLRSILKTV